MTTPENPFGLLAELTYRCPLACAYCSNPLELAAYDDELSTEEWQRVLTEAREMGVLQASGISLLYCCAKSLMKTHRISKVTGQTGMYTEVGASSAY